jgi:sialate O-acetylesterase
MTMQKLLSIVLMTCLSAVQALAQNPTAGGAAGGGVVGSAASGGAALRLPSLISDSMVLQRDKPIHIWGWASPGEKIRVEFNGHTSQTRTGTDGKWMVMLPAMRAGGPYSMRIQGNTTIDLKGIDLGDVYFCSGQSNMGLTMERAKEKYPQQIDSAYFDGIRNFFVPTVADVKGPHDDMPVGKWLPTTPQNVLGFGAATFFFARALYNQYHIPIGIINSSVGGTPIQSWISADSIQAFPDAVRQIKAFDASTNAAATSAGASPAAADKPAPDLGLWGPLPWYDPRYVPDHWYPFWLPGYWEDQGIKGLNGIVWFRKEIQIPASMAGKSVKLYLGRIVDADQVYVNGVQVGSTTYQYPPRRYTIPAGLLKEGTNLMVVRVTNTAGKGGFVPQKRYVLTTGSDSIDLRGDWTYQVGQVFGPGKPGPLLRQNIPTSLYNTMVAPFTPFSVKGFIWYQGEANWDHPETYGALLQTLILDWRSKWKDSTLPFLYVQLPNFQEAQYSPANSNWASVREAQRQTLAIPHTAMAVTIDLGEWNDIHPLDKKDVGERLALAADYLIYGHKDLVYSGPMFRWASIDGPQVDIDFGQTGSGLVAKGGGPLKGFSIAGADQKYVWAQASIKGNTVVLQNPSVLQPRYVRYAWADNPREANLYNQEGLPASPFQSGLIGGSAAGVASGSGAGSAGAGSAQGSGAGSAPGPGADGPWNHKSCAVVLTYDDAVDIDLDHVLPALDSEGFKGTFYLIGTSYALIHRINEWKAAAAEGHELGNHTLFHPCDATKPGRNWLTPETDLSRYTVKRATQEILATNALLSVMDGKTQRTFAYPCGDLNIGDTLFYKYVSKDFAGARGVEGAFKTIGEIDLDNIPSFAIADQSGAALISLVNKAMETHSLLVFLFHGVGGGHVINEGWAEHTQLLQFLKAHEQDIWIAPMVDVAQYIKDYQMNHPHP